LGAVDPLEAPSSNNRWPSLPIVSYKAHCLREEGRENALEIAVGRAGWSLISPPGAKSMKEECRHPLRGVQGWQGTQRVNGGMNKEHGPCSQGKLCRGRP
jgi:hypothetical protein